MWLLLALAGCSSEPPAPERRPDVLLFTVDTTRADALGLYGATPSPSTRLDALARESVVVDEAMSVCPLTLPAHSSIMTGLYPDRHGVRTNDGFVLDPKFDTLAEKLQSSGYQTAAFVAAAVLDDGFGLHQGFATYSDGRKGAAGHVVPSRPAREVADEASTAVVQSDPSRPLFLWTHFYDPHLPLDPPEPFKGQFEDAYAAEIAAMDDAIGQVLDAHRLARKSDPIVVVVGDHGESRGEHGEATHGMLVYRSTMRVPLLIRAPGLEPRRVPGPVSQVDLMPTLLELVELPVSAVDGRSVLPHLRGEPQELEPVYGESLMPRLSFGMGELVAVQDAGHRVVAGPRVEGFDWKVDPGELAPVEPQSGLMQWLSKHQERPESSPLPTHQPTVGGQALAALGYLEGVVATDAPTATLDDPRDHLDVLALTQAVTKRAAEVEPAQAVRMLEAFVASHPTVAGPRLSLSAAYEQLGQLRQARDILDPLLSSDGGGDVRVRLRRVELALMMDLPDAMDALVALRAEMPEWAEPLAVHAEQLRVSGEPAQALEMIESSPVRWQQHGGVQRIRAACLLDRGQGTPALEALQVVEDQAAPAPELWRLRARAHALNGDLDQGLLAVDKHLSTYPNDVVGKGLRGLLLVTLSRPEEALPELETAAADPRAELEVLLALADLRSRAGAVEEAGGLLDRAEAQSPGDPRIQRLRADWLLQQGRFDEAQQLMGR